MKVTSELIYVYLSHESPLFKYRIRVKEYDRMICGDLRENRKRWWKVRRTNQPATPMSTSAFPVLSWAAEHPKRCHDIGKMPESRKAAELLVKRGVIEIRDPMNQYRLKPAPK